MKSDFISFILSNKPYEFCRNSFFPTIYLYIRKNYLDSEKSNPASPKKIKISSLKLMLSFFSLLLNSDKSIYFKLERTNLSNDKDFSVFSFHESTDRVTFRDLVYLIRTALLLLMLPVSFFSYVYIVIKFKNFLTMKDFKSIALAVGDMIFLHIVKLFVLLNENEVKLYFSAAIIPDAAVFDSSNLIVEVSHGVIHNGHPTYYLLRSRRLPIIVESNQQAKKVIENGCDDIAIVDPSFFRGYFVFDVDAPKVFIAQFGETFEKEGVNFLEINNDYKVRFHPRNSTSFKNQFNDRCYVENNVSYVASISSSMVLDAQIVGIPYMLVYSQDESLESEFKYSREGLL
ncbi:conserved hypothetical protein [Vibrio chagasii]|nr:conserved hypothetical protein [Vibrio chagasii]CAH7155930.1 conserved hypothetical protein [Vibrio chagasii]CAH7210137.1 conserved hypothetical protein [Vibrio chagasii]